MRTAKEIFDEELSGEPLYQSAVIEAIQIAQKDAIDTALKISHGLTHNYNVFKDILFKEVDNES